MARRFSWCTAVALVVLLFVTTEGLRERGTQVDDQKTAGRGTLRFNSRSLEESTTASLSRSRSQDRSQSRKSNFERNDRTTSSNFERNDRTTSSNFERNDRTTSPTDSESTTKRPSPTASDVTEIPARRTTDPNRRNGKRFSPERTRSKDENAIDSKVISRKVSNGRSDGVTERLDNTGPSVFALTTESSRSRTGRKIQTTFSTKDLKTQIPASRRYNKKSENVETTTVSFKRGRPTTERSRSGRSKVNRENSVARKGQEALLYESESVRVDIPLAVDGTESPSSDPTTVGFGIVSQRRSDTKETLRGRSGAERKSRGRSSDSEAAGSSRNGSRRGSSRFNDFSTTEANEVGSRKAASRDRLKETRKSASESRSRSRGREQAKSADVDVKRKSGDRNSLDRRSRLSEGTTRSVESRGQDQDARRSRSRARTETTPLATDVTTTVAPETTVFTDSTSTEPEVSSTTLKPTTTSTTTRSTSRSSSTTERNRGRGRGNQGRKLKEDFFNHGLGFRGRKPSLDASNTGESRRPIPKNDSYINPGWTLRRRPPNLNYSDNLPQTIPSSRDQTNEVIPQNEVSTSTEIVTTVETSTSTARRGSKKLQSTEESTTEMDVTTKSFRRGNKTFEKNRNVAPGKQEHEESDNYPPEFKARLSLLKSTNTKIPAPKTTSRTPLEDQKNTFGRRSRSNSRTIEDLENAASGDLVVKDQNFIEFALINANGLRRVKRSSAALFAERSRMKLELARRLVKPELNIEENDLDATTASSFSKPRPTVASTVDETAKVAKFVKPSAGRRTSTEKRSREDEKSKVSARTGDDSSRFARPNSKKGRIISERMVTSISVEERAAEQTTKPYSSSQSVVTLSSAEEGSATTIDTTRIRLSSARNGKKSKEETSKRREHDDTITTFKPKKPYAYQSRVTKSQEQSTTPEENLVTSKKTYASSKQNGGQRKFQSSREEDARRTKSTTVTKPTFRPRYSKRTKPKSIDDKLTDYEATITTKVPVATSRYSRKKSVVKATEGKSKTTTEGVATQTKKLEFRPRTATYRRHSEVPTTLVESSTKVEGAGVAITPRSTKYSATLKTSTESARSVAQEPQVNLRISNDTAQEAAGITGSSNGDTGSNIFNPTRSTILAGNGTLLEQLRSTVAPLLNSLGNKTPVFSGSYSNVNVNSAPRITPNGSPPRFSARYKGAELFVRKQNNIYQPTVPSITSSSTTPATTVENSGSAPPIDVSSPGEPRFLTLYHALESADIRNELEANTSVQADRVLQDTTSATAQGTAGSGIGQTTENTTPMTMTPSTPSPMQSTTQSLVSTTSSSVETTTTTPTMTTTTQTTTKIGRVPELATTQSSMGVVTVTPMPDTTVPTTVTGAVEDNLVSTEAGTTMQPMGPMNATMMTMNATAANTTAETTTPSMQTTPATSTMAPSSQAPTTAYMGRFGGSRLTPAPRFSLSSTTRAPLRDYLVYGIYPNKTIVRKRPEDNLIDARNVDSPYVIFGIFPDGRLVRKFPNGTIIPDPPRSPVEVVFSLSTTTTTNRPPPRPYYNQANQGVYNQYQGPVYSNIRRPEPMRIVQSPGTVDLGLTGNAIVGPNGGGPGFTGPLGTPASLPSTNEMSNALVNTQMGTASVTPTVSTGRPPTVSQGGRIVQDRERDEATRTKEVGGQRSSVYIGQDKFVNYWTDGASTTNPRVLGVKINSVATGSNLGPSPSVPSFANLLNNEPGGQVTAPPGFPWRDPLDQIFGITTSSPIITASVASNSLDDSSESSNPTAARPVNPFVEIFTPLSNAIGMPRGNGVLSVTGAVPSTTMQTTPITTTMAPTPPATPSTSATPPPPPSTPTTTIAPTTTTTPSTTTPQPTTAQTNAASQAPQSTPGSTGPPSTTPTNLPANLLNNMQQQNAFGTSFNDLVFLNSLLQDNSRGSKTKTLTQVEQLLANKILSLALNGPDPGPTRAPKAISFENASPNSVYQSPKSYEPIVIDLSPSSTATSPTWKPTQQTSQKAPISSTTEQVTQTSISTTTAKRDIITSAPSTTDKTTLISTTKVPVSPKTVTRPRTTTEAPVGLAGLLWQTLLGGGLFGPSTTERPLRTKQVKTVTKSVNITPKPIPTTQRPTTTSTTTTTTTTTTTARTTTVNTIDISKIHVSTPNSIGVEKKAATPVPLLSTTKKSLLNNPNPRLSVPTSTFSPEEETRFLLSILRAAQQDEKAGGSKNSLDDEAFLRAILSGQASPTSTPPPQTEISNAALLAALLKAQGIEPETPATNIREQLQLASLGQSVTSAPSLSPASSGSTTITTRPTSTATRATDTTKNTVTPRPTSRPRVRTTTWSPSSTYPPPLFSSFSNYATPGQSAAAGNSDNGAIFGATRAFSQFLGAALSGAAQQLQSLVRNGTRIVSEVVG
ncbi:uncharacterized protein LOC100879044 isoform X10 [Megachile rotundata]|uniref:uncharacterized protein LOC100879044 isoform X10 n=1 Tax=Megachile rotundata TaxID=143995 RepID=UPI003FCF93A1